MRTISSIEDAKALEGVEVGLSDWVVIDQTRIDQFAEATGDYQWIHVDYTPVRVGDRVRARATVLQARRRAGALLLTSETRIEVEDERKPACVAETLGMYFFSE